MQNEGDAGKESASVPPSLPNLLWWGVTASDILSIAKDSESSWPFVVHRRAWLAVT
ncbi:MAG: hypothetical protein FWG02_08915 [Holophagaceae bacterium]|nr:hypothetical protein [Holophagaceae bacterium]